MSSQLRRLLPLLVAAAAIAYVAHITDGRQFLRELAHAPKARLIAVSAVFTLVNCAADTLAMFYVFRWFGLRLRFFDLYTIRAATYTLAVLNYHAGQLGIIGFLHRAGKVPLSKASGWILFIIGVWVGLLLLIGSLGVLLGGAQGHMLYLVLVVFVLAVAVYVPLLLWQPRFLRHPPRFLPEVGGTPAQRLLRRGWVLATAILQPLLEVGLWGHVRALVVRLPHLAVLVAWHFFALRCFRVEVPLTAALLYLPLVFAASALPISPQGLGVTQAVAPFFFARYAVGGHDAVVAYSVCMSVISIASNLTMGLLFLRRGASLGLTAAARAPEVDEAGEAPEVAVAGDIS